VYTCHSQLVFRTKQDPNDDTHLRQSPQTRPPRPRPNVADSPPHTSLRLAQAHRYSPGTARPSASSSPLMPHFARMTYQIRSEPGRQMRRHGFPILVQIPRLDHPLVHFRMPLYITLIRSVPLVPVPLYPVIYHSDSPDIRLLPGASTDRF
jgi:hypothetical protein